MRTLTHREPHRSIAFTPQFSLKRAGKRPLMSLRDFIAKQWIDVIEWVEPEEASGLPLSHAGSRNPDGGKLTVPISQLLFRE